MDHVAKEAPRILHPCMLLDGVEDGECPLVELNRLNAAESGLTFLWRGDHVTVAREVGLDAVRPRGSRERHPRLVTQVDGWAATSAERVRAGAEARPAARAAAGSRRRTP